mmetsp:Transcript_100727/g.194644  ORF Transcript_100727/g.194644 Transcript_100727/m.194644 type:complete len:196 (-) Transcript_100727:3-590(-)
MGLSQALGIGELLVMLLVQILGCNTLTEDPSQAEDMHQILSRCIATWRDVPWRPAMCTSAFVSEQCQQLPQTSALCIQGESSMTTLMLRGSRSQTEFDIVRQHHLQVLHLKRAAAVPCQVTFCYRQPPDESARQTQTASALPNMSMNQQWQSEPDQGANAAVLGVVAVVGTTPSHSSCFGPTAELRPPMAGTTMA